MAPEVMERLPPSGLVEAAQPLAVEQAELAAAGGGQLAEIEIPWLERTRGQRERQAAGGEDAEAGARQHGEVDQRGGQGGVAEAPLLVLVVLQVVEKQEGGGDGDERLPQFIPELPLGLVRRQAGGARHREPRRHLLDQGGGGQRAAGADDEHAGAARGPVARLVSRTGTAHSWGCPRAASSIRPARRAAGRSAPSPRVR